VGAEVLEAFRAAAFTEDEIRNWFRPEVEDIGVAQLEATELDSRRPVSVPRHRAGRYRLDVAKANVDQLRAAGLDAANIAACGLCTACHPSVFPSYRRDGAGTGRFAGVIRRR
jgi:copper oxidase (laccase) domain-containing protein